MIDRNLRLYPIYQIARGMVFWLPIFFLYFSSRFSAGEVLKLEAIYYLGVVLLEVPSGVLSDRLNRRLTLVCAAGFWVLGCAVFATTQSFSAFVFGQLCLAAGMAFNSGTDSALLYDSLKELDRVSEFGAHESRAISRTQAAGAFGALIGGLLSGVDLRLAYVLSGASAFVALVLAWLLVEPTREDNAEAFASVSAIFSFLKDPALQWVFGFAVVMTVLNHVPYEFLQPWLVLWLAGEGVGSYSLTPAVAGTLTAVSMGLAAVASAHAARLQRRAGSAMTLLCCLGLQGLIIVSMAPIIHPLVAVLLALRSAPGSVSNVVIRMTIHPRISSQLRATWLSLQSLVGRLAFSIALVLTAWRVGDIHALNGTGISVAVLPFAVLAGASVLVLGLTHRALQYPPSA